MLRHMLSVGVLAEDEGIIGFGATGEREFGRRHFSDLVAAFSSPLLLAVHHGQSDLGTVHPASLARRPSDTTPVLLLGGRSWKVTDVDWTRRRVSVVPVESGGRSRWIGAGRMLPFSICRAEERIIAGGLPACRLSRRATDQLARIRDRLEFVDGNSLPLESNGVDRVTAWLFAGGIVSASIARVLTDGGVATVGWDDVSVTVRTADIATLRRGLASVDTQAAHPALPDDLLTALKFGLCLPPQIAETVVIARTSNPEEMAAAMSRPVRSITIPMS